MYNHNSHSIHPMVLRHKSDVGLHCLLVPQRSISSGQLPIATTQKSGSILLHHNFYLFLGITADLIPTKLALSTFLGIRVPSILWTCPSQ
jgi:hypothetical protein